MKAIFTLAIKDLRLISRDYLGMFFIAIFPILMGVLFGMISASFGPSDNPGAALQLAVIDQDQSEMSSRFVKSLDNLDAIQVQGSESEQEAARAVLNNRYVGFISIPPGFGETAGIIWAEGPAIRVGVDPSRQAEAGMIQGHVMQAMGELIQHRFMNPTDIQSQLDTAVAGIDSDAEVPAERKVVLKGLLSTVSMLLGSLGDFTEQMKHEGGGDGPSMQIARIEPVDIKQAARAEKHQSNKLVDKIKSRWDISFPSAIMWGVMASVAGFAITIARERTNGTFFRLKIAPISHMQILAGKGLACFFTVLGVISMMMVLGKLLGIQLARPDLLILATLSTALGFVGIMMLMSVIGRTEQAVGGAGWAIIVTMCMFGGGMIPLAFMPSWMLKVTHFSPVKWGTLALEGAIWRDFTFVQMLQPCGILLAIGVVGFLIGSRILSRAEE